METTKIKMNMDGTIRAKVLQYKSDGNTLTEKRHILTKFAEGIYFSYTTPDRYGHRSINVIFSKNGIFWRVGGEPEHYFNPESFRYAENMETLKKRYANYEADILQAAENGGWLNKLHITVLERLGYDVASLLVAYEDRKRKRQEEQRKRIEAAEKAEQERVEAEERRKAEVLADGKEKLLKHERITVEQIEFIAEAVGYKIHIRTIGFMREKVTEAVLREDNSVTVWGRKLTSRNIDGTANVMRKLRDLIKAQAKEEAPEIKPLCETTCEERPTLDDHYYYTWLMMHEEEGSYMTIADKALAEALAWIYEAAYRKGKGHIIAMNKDGVLIETLIAATPAETPQIVRVEIVRDFDKSYYANLYNENGVCHNLSKEYTDFRTLKTLCKKEYGVNLPNLSQIEFETYGRKSYAYINAETPQISTEPAETANISKEDENAAERTTNEPRKVRMKSYARITGQHNRLWLAANGNKTRQDRISAIWYRYTANISKHFKNPFMSEWDARGADELPRSIYAATNARECSTADAAYW